MPTYDLVCEECGHKFSVFCSISQKENQTCPECSSDKITQRFTGVNVIGGKNNDFACSLGRSGNCPSSGSGFG